MPCSPNLWPATRRKPARAGSRVAPKALTGVVHRATFGAAMSTSIHASCVELDGVGILLRGPSGMGKSDLALRLIDGGARLVADDRVALEAGNGGLYARAPDALLGLIEVHGLGLRRLPALKRARLGLVADLVDAALVERMPEEDLHCTLEGVALPLVRLCPFEPSAPAKLRLAAAS
jgi:HPr kinase/phosphorylase